MDKPLNAEWLRRLSSFVAQLSEVNQGTLKQNRTDEGKGLEIVLESKELKDPVTLALTRNSICHVLGAIGIMNEDIARLRNDQAIPIRAEVLQPA